MDYTFIADLVQQVQIPANGILSRTLYNDERLKIVIFAFSEGQELSAHTAPMPAVIQILQGEAELTLGNDKMAATAGALARMAPNLNHAIVAKTGVVMLLFMMK
ncbi:MAG: cupin domain-containing protein [Acidobacteria bacterium]|nr:cupin domain-containing protein [Acidobacteriota bacterium]